MEYNPNFMEPINQEETPEVDQKEVRRKAIASKRVFFLLLVLSLILVGLLIWELIEISLGGRP